MTDARALKTRWPISGFSTISARRIWRLRPQPTCGDGGAADLNGVFGQPAGVGEPGSVAVMNLDDRAPCLHPLPHRSDDPEADGGTPRRVEPVAARAEPNGCAADRLGAHSG